MQTRKFLSNNKGLSLVEIMIGAAILGGLSLMVMRLTGQSTKTSVKLTFDADTVSVLNEINSVLSDPTKCRLTFTKDPLTNEFEPKPSAIVTKFGRNATTNKPELLPDDGSYGFKTISHPMASKDDRRGYGNSGVEFISFELVRNAADPDDPAATLEVNFKNKNILKGKSTRDTITRRIPMYLSYDESDKFASCRSLQGNAEMIWKRGDAYDIFYNAGEDGKVGIGTDVPEATFHIEGDVIARNMSALSFKYDSDARLKKNVETVKGPIEKIKALNGVSFEWNKDNTKDYGFIAQEVQQVVPDIVKQKNNKKKTLTVDYAKIVPILVEAIKKQQVQINELKAKLNEK